MVWGWLWKIVISPLVLQAQGYDWNAEFAHFPFAQPTPVHFPVKTFPKEAIQRHRVKNSQAFKSPAVRSRLTGDEVERNAFARQVIALYDNHGVPNGILTCDEDLDGREPQQGSAGIREVVTFHFSDDELLPYQGQFPFDVIGDPEKDLYHRYGIETSIWAILNPRGARCDRWQSPKRQARLEGKPEMGPIWFTCGLLDSPDSVIRDVHYGTYALLAVTAKSRFDESL